VTPKDAFEWIMIAWLAGMVVLVFACFAKALFSRE
jgi:hypothetical protein